MTDEAKPYKWEQDARANNAEAAVQFERARAEAAEAQRDRMAAALEERAFIAHLQVPYAM